MKVAPELDRLARDPIRRQKMLRICDSHPDLPPFLFHVNKMERCDEILNWLLKTRLTGSELVGWIRFHFDRSLLSAIAGVLRRIDRDEESKPIIAGKDYKV